MQRRVRLTFLLLGGLGLSSCTLLFGSLTPATCEEGQAPLCQGNILVRCEAGFEIEQDCAPNICQQDSTGAFCQGDIPPDCGNGVLDEGEACDDGNNEEGDGCDGGCQIEVSPTCGDGTVDISNGEDCDDGNQTNGDGCDTNCTQTACGNNIVTTGEDCDDGNLNAGDGCDESCQIEIPATCGDGALDAGEECDDGNQINGDGCDQNCTQTACGNNIVTTGEDCDDGNLNAGDGCEPDCTIITPQDLVVTDFQIERHDLDLVYFVTIANVGDIDINGFVRVDVYHDRGTPPSVGSTGDRSAFVSSLPAGSSATVSMLLAIAETDFDLAGTVRDDWARVDPLDALAEGIEDNNLAGPLDGAMVRDFCTRCVDNTDCDFGECLTINETDEQFCSGAPCASNADCNTDAACIQNRCRPILNTCNANCDPRAEVIDITTSDFVDNNDGSFSATFTGSTEGNPDLTGPRDGGTLDACGDGEGDAGEAFFILHLTEGAFPTGLLGASASADIVVDTIGTNNFGDEDDTMLYLRTECMDERQSAQINCDDDSGDGPQLDAELTVTQLLKGTYVIVLDGFDPSNDGDFVLNIQVTPN